MKMDKFTDTEETIFFYTWNNYRLIQDWYMKRFFILWKNAEEFNFTNKRLLEEYNSGKRAIKTMLDDKIINGLKNRIFNDIKSEETKDKILEFVENDIANICTAMIPTKERIMLYRTEKNVPDNYKANPSYSFASIISSSIKPYEEDETEGFHRFEITIPKNKFMLELDKFEAHNEDGQVLLPPMKSKITNTRSSDNAKCKGIIEVEIIYQARLVK